MQLTLRREHTTNGRKARKHSAMNQNTNTATLETLKAEETRLAQVKAALKEAQSLAKWEAETRAINPQYVFGSVRKPTAEDEAALGHSHGRVCSIRCLSCGEERTVNLQDAKQVVYCKFCKKDADKAKSKTKRASKRLAGKSVADIQAEIEAAQKQLEALQGKVA